MLAQLTGFEIFYGSFTFASVIISTILGFFIALKYVQYKKIELLLVGITWILLASPYWSDAIQFITNTFFGISLDPPFYFFLANAFIAPIHITWSYAFTNLLFKKQQKKIMLFFGIEALIFELAFLIVFLINPFLIGDQRSAFVVEWAIWIQIYLLFSIILFLVTGFLFARSSLKSEDSEIKLKGKFLILAFMTFTIGTMIDVIGAESPTEITIFLARTFVIISSICFYIGFTLPRFIKNFFIKE
ncbi:MAG: hypothetical protein HWN81_20675 [Candidatus Lokiarchaeota archaeon]|nr:hypothetical protein [Candidatus Lokiarchaeota archaeon]